MIATIVKKILKGFAFFIFFSVFGVVIASYFNFLPHPNKPKLEKSYGVYQTVKTTPEISAIKDDEVPILNVSVQVAPATEKQEEKITCQTVGTAPTEIKIIPAQSFEPAKTERPTGGVGQIIVRIPNKREMPIIKDEEVVLTIAPQIAQKTMPEIPVIKDDEVPILNVSVQVAPATEKQEEKITCQTVGTAPTEIKIIPAQSFEPAKTERPTGGVGQIIVREIKPDYQNQKIKKRGFFVVFKANKTTPSSFGKKRWWGERKSYCLADQNQSNQALAKHFTSALLDKMAYKSQKK